MITIQDEKADTFLPQITEANVPQKSDERWQWRESINLVTS
jgi:hypothetical protein